MSFLPSKVGLSYIIESVIFYMQRREASLRCWVVYGTVASTTFTRLHAIQNAKCFAAVGHEDCIHAYTVKPNFLFRILKNLFVNGTSTARIINPSRPYPSKSEPDLRA